MGARQTRCLTKNPRLEANKELKDIAQCLTDMTRNALQTGLDLWHEEHGEWLKERDDITKQYVHKRTRQAYFSLRRNLPYLFTYLDEELIKQGIKIPNTTNALEGRFGVWKPRLQTHRGCSKELKTKILRSFFSRTTG
jgi:hypothetical protein